MEYLSDATWSAFSGIGARSERSLNSSMLNCSMHEENLSASMALQYQKNHTKAPLLESLQPSVQLQDGWGARQVNHALCIERRPVPNGKVTQFPYGLFA